MMRFTKEAEFQAFCKFEEAESRFIDICLNASDLSDLRQELDTLDKIKERRLSEGARSIIDHIYETAKYSIAELNPTEYERLLHEKNKCLEFCAIHNVSLVTFYARKWCKREMKHPFYDDILQEGHIGLIHAILRFNPHLGIKFSTYASFWIKQSIGRYEENNKNVVRVPTHLQDQISQIDKIYQKKKTESGDCDYDSLLENRRSRKEILRIGKVKVVSLDVPITSESDFTMMDTLVSDCSLPDATYFFDETQRVIDEMLNFCTDREREVLKYRFGLCGYSPITLKEIGDILDLSRERVRQIEVDGLRKMKNRARSLGTVKLKEYLENGMGF